MTGWTKDARAKEQHDIGVAQVKWAKHGRDSMGLKMSNSERLALSKEGIKNQMEARIKMGKSKRAKEAKNPKPKSHSPSYDSMVQDATVERVNKMRAAQFSDSNND